MEDDGGQGNHHDDGCRDNQQILLQAFKVAILEESCMNEVCCSSLSSRENSDVGQKEEAGRPVSQPPLDFSSSAALRNQRNE